MKNLSSFLEAATTPYHAVACVKARLMENGFSQLDEREAWQLCTGGKYFVCRGGAIVAFVYSEASGFVSVLSHSDFPALAVKGDSPLGDYLRLSVERYGGMINYTWLDRPLTVSGRVMINEGGAISEKLVRLDFPVVIPSVAIHLRRSVNDGFKAECTDLVPLASVLGGRSLMEELSVALGEDKENILSYDLWLSSAEKPQRVGMSGELLLSPRLDNLASVYSTLVGFLNSKPKNKLPIYAVFNNEEVGSQTADGAASTLLRDVMLRIAGGEERLLRMLAASFSVSVDNAHAKHPNHPELSDSDNAPIMGQGIAVKHNANKRYATDAYSEARLRMIAKGSGLRLQNYYNRPDIPGGSTLGSILTSSVSLPTVDIGIPQLAMHSICETAAISDIEDMARLAEAVFSSELD